MRLFDQFLMALLIGVYVFSITAVVGRWVDLSLIADLRIVPSGSGGTIFNLDWFLD